MSHRLRNYPLTKVKKLTAIGLFSALLISTSAFAYEVVDVCATYSNTGKSYKVQGQIYKGTELNQSTSSFDYSPFSTYVVIFWSQGQASIIELGFFLGGLSPFGSSGTDQRGYEWKIKEGHTYCW